MQRGNRSLVAFIACAPAGAVDRLLQSVYRQDAKAHRNAVTQRHLLQASGGLAGHVLEVRCVSPNDGAESHDTAVGPGFRRDRGGSRQLECAGEPHHIHHVPLHPCFAAAQQGTLQELGGNQFVVAAHQDRRPPAGAQPAGEVGHWVSG